MSESTPTNGATMNTHEIAVEFTARFVQAMGYPFAMRTVEWYETFIAAHRGGVAAGIELARADIEAIERQCAKVRAQNAKYLATLTVSP